MSPRITVQASILILVVAVLAVIVPSVRSQRMAEPLRIEKLNRHFSSAFDKVAGQYNLDADTRARARSVFSRPDNRLWNGDRTLNRDRTINLLSKALRESRSFQPGDSTDPAEFSRKFLDDLTAEIDEAKDPQEKPYEPSHPDGDDGGDGGVNKPQPPTSSKVVENPEPPLEQAEHSDNPERESTLLAIIFAFLAEHWFVGIVSAIVAGWVYWNMRQ
jgi:hypothetical protein